MAFTKQDKLRISCFCIILGSIISCGTVASSKELPSICESKCKKSINSTETEKYCNQNPGREMQHRCCVNSSTSAIIGIDLQQCSKTRDMFVSGTVNLWHLVIISLEGNPITKIQKTDFHNNTQIQYLSLPPKVPCPGGNYTWKTETYSSDRAVCIDELDPCIALNFTCPDFSYCVHVGVNMTNCLCENGYHGYKCMNQGKFPFLEYGIGISIPTVILCIFLWVTQRRHVKTTPKY